MKPLLSPAAVFFDLDGTLLDTAPDFVDAVEALCRELGAPRPDREAVRGAVSAGGRAMLAAGLPAADAEAIERWLPRYLDLYAAGMTRHTRLFDGIAAVLAALEARSVPWGIVTNKPGWLARPLLAEMPFYANCAALVSGDCLPVRKPDPEPLREACRLAGVGSAGSVYVGDDRRDVEAGRGAGMKTIVAGWGYLAGSDPRSWGADLILECPGELMPALGLGP